MLSRDVADNGQRQTLNLLALASLETTPELGTGLHDQIQRRARGLLPPKNRSAAKSFASAGPFVLDLLAKANPTTVQQTIATVHALAETGLPEAIPLLAKYRDDSRAGVRDELIKSWDSFNHEEYARQVLPNMTIEEVQIEDNTAKLHALRHLRRVTHLSATWLSGNEPDLRKIPTSLRHLKLTQIIDHKTTPTPVDLSQLTHATSVTSLVVTAWAIENFSAIARLPELTDIEIHGTSINPAGLSVPDQTAIRRVTISGVDHLAGLVQLRFLKNVECLNLYDMSCLFNLNGAKQWQSCLQSLNISRCPVKNISSLSDFHELKDLSLSRTRVDDISPLRKMRLHRLDLSHSPISDISPLAGLTTLRSLDLRETRVSDISVLRKLPGLTEVHLPDSQGDDRPHGTADRAW